MKFATGIYALVFGGMVGCMVGPAGAVVLPADEMGRPVSGEVAVGSLLTERPELQGTLLAESSQPYALSAMTHRGTVWVSGRLEQKVIRESSGTLDFYFRLVNDAPDPARPSTNVFPFLLGTGGMDAGGGGVTELGYLADPLAVAPAATWLSPAGAADFLHFGSGVPVGTSSAWLFVRTSATDFDSGGQVGILYDLFGEAAFTGFSPVPAVGGTVPEPATLALLTMGLLALGRRRP